MSKVVITTLQWALRAIALASTAAAIGLVSYFLVTLNHANGDENIKIKAMAGIAGTVIVYVVISFLLMCFLSGLKLFSYVAVFLDIGFLGALGYVGWKKHEDAKEGGGNMGGGGNMTSASVVHRNVELPTSDMSLVFRLAIGAIFFLVIILLFTVYLRKFVVKRGKSATKPAFKENNVGSTAMYRDEIREFGTSDLKRWEVENGNGHFYEKRE